MTIKFLLKQHDAVSNMSDAYLKAAHHEEMAHAVPPDTEAYRQHMEEMSEALSDLERAKESYADAVCEEIMEE